MGKLELSIISICLLQVGCGQSHQSDQVVNKDKISEFEKSDTYTSLICNDTLLSFPSCHPFTIHECEDTTKDLWENVTLSSIRTSYNSLDVLSAYKAKMGYEATNIHLVDVEVVNSEFVATYFYRGCVGDLCRTVLKVEFNVDSMGQIKLSKLYDHEGK